MKESDRVCAHACKCVCAREEGARAVPFTLARSLARSSAAQQMTNLPLSFPVCVSHPVPIEREKGMSKRGTRERERTDDQVASLSCDDLHSLHEGLFLSHSLSLSHATCARCLDVGDWVPWSRLLVPSPSISVSPASRVSLRVCVFVSLSVTACWQ